MREKTLPQVEAARVTAGRLGSDASFGNNGLFHFKRNGKNLCVVASDGLGWDHVSVSLKHRCPTWPEMCFIKQMFFEPGETVIQFHPAQESYVNVHSFTLHMWRKQGEKIEMPPICMV